MFHFGHIEAYWFNQYVTLRDKNKITRAYAAKDKWELYAVVSQVAYERLFSLGGHHG